MSGPSTNDFVTSDVWLTAALTCILKKDPGYSLDSDGRTVFLFSKSPALYKAIEAYNGGFPLPAYHYAQACKRLRGEMHARRGKGAKR